MISPVPRMVLILVVLIAASGCGRFDNSYGPSKGTSGRKSLNGFGAFRDTLDEVIDDTKSRDLFRLSGRAMQRDAIVWVPQQWAPANEVAVTDWMESWLAMGHKTLVFIVPDDGSEDAYWELAAQIAPPEQSLEFRRQRAITINERLILDAQRDDVRVDDWFIAQAISPEVRFDEHRRLRFRLLQSEPISIDDSAEPSEADDVTAGEESAEDTDGVADVAVDVDADTFELSRARVFEPLLTAGDDDSNWVTLAKVTDPDWDDSQILVVAGGGLLTNFAMTQPEARQITRQVISEISRVRPPESGELEIGYLVTDNRYLPISNVQASSVAATGMETLTTWPLSLLTIHGLFLGVVMCLMLLPAFGRPRSVQYNQVSQFGNHIDAMAKLMQRASNRGSTKNVDYARQKISHYLRRVRGETSGPWLLPEPSARDFRPSPINVTPSQSPATPDSEQSLE